LRTKRTRFGATIWTSFTLSFRSLAPLPFVPVEGKLHVLGGDGIAVVEADTFAEDEFIGEPVLGHGPRLGEVGVVIPAGMGLTRASWMA